MNATRLWIIGATLVAVLLVAGGWFLGISPQLAAAAAADSQRASVLVQNTGLEADLASMIADSKHIKEEKAKLAALQRSIPADVDISDFMREVLASATQRTVAITGVTVGEGQPYAGAVEKPAAAAATPAAEGSTSTPTPSPSASPAATPAPAAAASTDSAAMGEPTSSLVTPTNFVAIPISLTVSGENANVLDFVESLQSGSRLMLVNVLTTKQAAAAATADSGDGDAPVQATLPTGTAVDSTISGYVYVYLSGGAAAPAPAAAG
ncbi:hypothetical protein [Leifsonia sp. Leaf264]|uniref:hypothetical protein n=1 Tax=Leifsonia sp. Leaf264 TaxID=1736314 RepID=UPI000700F50E|nr:hypothetical protein [Leifsonia sp. Leaf264]KQO97393.1 hypothetical protein ASF30_13160 [Leifsonia sp. Leaf264]